MSLRKNASRKVGLFQRSAISIAVGLVISSTALAQSSEGSVSGQGKPGAQGVMTSVDSGAVRQFKVDANGKFQMSKVPPGRYKITSGGVTQEVDVAIGSGTTVMLDAVERVQVVGGRARNTMDFSSAESSTVFSQAQLQALPVPRDISAIAALAPGVVRGDKGFTNDGEAAANLPSFGGASVAENGYYINGFDVTNIRNFLSYSSLPFDAIAEQQIKTGGYGAEYGRSLGGVVSLATKRGTNTWKGGVSVYWEPKSLRSDGQNVRDLEPTQNVNYPNYRVFKKANTEDNLNYNVYGGGPLIENKLFVFGLIEGKREKSDDYNSATLTTTERSVKPNGMIKIDFLPTENHRFEFTGIDNKKKTEITDYTNPAGSEFSTTHIGPGANSTRESGGTVAIGKYTAYLTEAFTVSALVGKVDYKRPKLSGARTAGAECAVVLDESVAEVGCWKGPFPGNGAKDPLAPEDKDKRDAYRLDLDYVLGDHTLRAGLDNQKFTTWEAGGSSYTGGAYYRYYQAPAAGTNLLTGSIRVPIPGNGTYVRERILQTTSGSYVVENKAFYVEDTWRVRKDVTLYGGLRWETFDNKNSDGVSFVKADNLIAPRIGAAWDAMGDQTLKIYGNLGRYYIPVASNTNVRSTRSEIFQHRWYTYTGKDPVTQAPLGKVQIGDLANLGSAGLPDPATVSDTDLKPMYQDEIILGFQKALAKGWTGGVKYTHRQVKNGMDDWCDGWATQAYAQTHGFPNAAAIDYHCMVVNPGKDVHTKIDDGTGNLVPFTLPASATGLPEYQRKYDALELTIEKAFDGKWGLQASYTYSKSKGNTEGYVDSIVNQSDAGITQNYDFRQIMDGSNGYLPNDRRHQIKIFGNYAINQQFRVGANLSMASGRPISCIGWPTADAATNNWRALYAASTFYCVNSAGATVLGSRGDRGRTAWTEQLDLQFAYLPQLQNKQKLTLQADIFNVLNSHKVVEVNEVGDFSAATSGGATGGQQSLNYGQPSQFQTPRYVRLTARWEF